MNNNNSTIKPSNSSSLSTNSSLQIKGSQLNSGKENRQSTTPPNANQRSFSYDQKDKNQNISGVNNPKKDVMKIIIAPQVQNVYNQNVNNIYIQNPQYDDKNKTNQNSTNSNNQVRNNYSSYDNTKSPNYPQNNRPNSVNKKDNNISLNKLNNSEIGKPQIREYNSNYDDKMNRSIDNQKYMHNNYLSNQNVLE